MFKCLPTPPRQREAIFSGPRAEVSRAVVGSGKLGRKVENFFGEISPRKTGIFMDLTTKMQTVMCFPKNTWVSPRTNLDLYSKKNILYCQSFVRRSNKDRWSQLRKNLFQEAMNPMYFLESSGNTRWCPRSITKLVIQLYRWYIMIYLWCIGDMITPITMVFVGDLSN